MIWSPFQLRGINFTGSSVKHASLKFIGGVNVICGASDTGKSFTAEAIDFMLGSKTPLRDIPERVGYELIELNLADIEGKTHSFERSVDGGSFRHLEFSSGNGETIAEEDVLREQHAHGRTDNLSGWLLSQIGLFDKRIRRNKRRETRSLSFRDLARLIVVQESEITKRGSPFLTGQYVGKTAELSTFKLLLTGADDSALIPEARTPASDNTSQIELIDEMIGDLQAEIEDAGHAEDELTEQLANAEHSIEERRNVLQTSQEQFEGKIIRRRELFNEMESVGGRLTEIAELVARFDLLRSHYAVDIERLTAIKESGSLFVHFDQSPCPLCGARPEDQHTDEDCDGNVEAIVNAASAEIGKIIQLSAELDDTVRDLGNEREELDVSLTGHSREYKEVDDEITRVVSPDLAAKRTLFSDLVENRASVLDGIDKFKRVQRLRERKTSLIDDEFLASPNTQIDTELSEAVLYGLSSHLERVLKAWNFPGEHRVHFDKSANDFVIDGKPRSSRGKGLRAITHAAVTLSLMEYCRYQSLPHPGLVVLDSPLLAYYEPEDADDSLQGTDLKERFYEYLVEHHRSDSQIIIVENQHPPKPMESRLQMTVFTGNPKSGRFGLFPRRG